MTIIVNAIARGISWVVVTWALHWIAPTMSVFEASMVAGVVVLIVDARFTWEK